MQNIEISIKVLNEFFANKNKYFVNEVRGHCGIPDDSSEGYQGEYNEFIKYFRHPEWPENIFFQEIYRTDSYGNNSSIHEYRFVEGKEKTIIVFEPF